MKGKRTNIDFSEHELTVQTSDIDLTVHTLKIPNRGSHHKFVIISGLGVTAVTGDFGNLVIDREIGFDNKDISDSYIAGKITQSSLQKIYKLDVEETLAEIEDLLETKTKPEDADDEDDEEDWLDDDEIDYLEALQSAVYDEIDYNHTAYREATGRFSDDLDCVPRQEKLDYCVQAIFDAFEEIGRRVGEAK